MRKYSKKFADSAPALKRHAPMPAAKAAEMADPVRVAGLDDFGQAIVSHYVRLDEQVRHHPGAQALNDSGCLDGRMAPTATTDRASPGIATPPSNDS